MTEALFDDGQVRAAVEQPQGVPQVMDLDTDSQVGRWQQEIPAACINVAGPISAAVLASQVARSLLVSSGAARLRRRD